MRATIKNYIDGAEKRREEGDEKGFSLIELIVVVAILGILVAVAIPVFGAIQDNAKKSALQNAASSGAVVAAAELAGPGGATGVTHSAREEQHEGLHPRADDGHHGPERHLRHGYGRSERPA